MQKYSGFIHLDEQISKIIKPISKKKKDNFVILNALTKNWQEIVGEKYYRYCYPKKVQFNTNNKTVLFVGCYNAAVAFALEGHQNYILEKIAVYFGYKVISNIKISQELREIEVKNSKNPPIIDEKSQEIIEESLKEISDKDLQETLRKLGKHIFSKKTS